MAEIKEIGFDELSQSIHHNAVNKNFWECDIILKLMQDKQFHPDHIKTVAHAFRAQKLMLMVSEISEAMEADRKDRYFRESISAVNGWISDQDFVPHFEKAVKDTLEDELADTFIRLLDFAQHSGIDLLAHVQAKHRYNKTRPCKHNKNY